jgi:hypothetical protein
MCVKGEMGLKKGSFKMKVGYSFKTSSTPLKFGRCKY